MAPNYILPGQSVVEGPELVLHIGVELPAQAVQARAHLPPALLVITHPPTAVRHHWFRGFGLNLLCGEISP